MKVSVFITIVITLLFPCNGEAAKCAREMQLCSPLGQAGRHPPCCPPADCLKIVIDVGGHPRSERYQCFTTPEDAPKEPIEMGPHGLNDEDARFWEDL